MKSRIKLVVLIVLTSVLIHCTFLPWASHFTGKGYEKLRKGQYSEAIEAFNKADEFHIENKKHRAHLYNGRGWAWYKKGNYKDAIADFSKAIENDKEFASPYANRGMVRLEQRKWALASQDFNRVLELAPESTETLVYLSVIATKQKKNKEADKLFSKALATDTPAGEYAYTKRGEIRFKLGEYQKALKDVNTALEKDPSYAEAYYQRARVFEKLGQVNKALADAKKAHDLDPEDHEYQRFLKDLKEHPSQEKSSYRVHQVNPKLG